MAPENYWPAQKLFSEGDGGANIPASALVDSKWVHASSRKDMVVPLDYTFHYQLLFSSFTLKGPVEIPCRPRPPNTGTRHGLRGPESAPTAPQGAPQNLATDFDNSVGIRRRPPADQDRPKTPPGRPQERPECTECPKRPQGPGGRLPR